MSEPATAAPVPQHCPTPRELDDLELLLNGALVPLRGFDEPGSAVTLHLPDELAHAPEVELVDPEGLPLARARRAAAGSWAVEPLARAEYGPFRRLYLTPAEVRERHSGRTVVPVEGPLSAEQVAELAGLGPVLLLVLCGTGRSALSPAALLRASLVATDGVDAVVVAVPLASHDDAAQDEHLGAQVTATYAGSDPVRRLRAAGRPSGRVAEIVDSDRPAPGEQGLVLFFTGLSGSGKSTIARALMDRLLESGERGVTSLDGDVVRRHLSAGLTFSRADRETNIRRIGWVAAEISRHGGVAVCSPIAPFADTRRDVRTMVADAGGAFFLVHVATPLEECERRDRKGLYAKARRGEIPDFTGISSPYEEPTDADVRVDTTGRSIDDVVDEVLGALTATGHVRTPSAGQPLVPPIAALAPATPADYLEPREPDPLDVVFVCTANICRSPYMEMLARHLAEDDAPIRFSSAGTHGFDAQPMDPEMAEKLLARRIDTSGFASRPITREIVDHADLVLTAESAHRTLLLEDHPGAFRKIFTLGQFVEAARRVPDDVHGRALVDSVGQRRGNADPSLDVTDPYRRGPEAIAAAAARLDELLAAAVDRLV